MNLCCSHCFYLRAWSAATRKQSPRPVVRLELEAFGPPVLGRFVNVIFVAFTVCQMTLCSSPCSLVCRHCARSHRSASLVRCPAYTLCQTYLCSSPCIVACRNCVRFNPCGCYCPLPRQSRLLGPLAGGGRPPAFARRTLSHCSVEIARRSAALKAPVRGPGRPRRQLSPSRRTWLRASRSG
jgi:hypothetical protein